MKLKSNYFVIPLVTVLVSVIGSRFTEVGLREWYGTIVLPPWTPPGAVIGAVWTTIFILSTIAAVLVWNRLGRDRLWRWLIGLFIANAVLNVTWSYLFFVLHWLGGATLEAALLDATVIALIALLWRRLRPAAYLLLPYAAWVAFATFLAGTIWRLNA